MTSQLRFLLKKKAHHLSTRSNQLIHFFASSEENPYFSFETMLWCSTMTNVSMYQVAKSLFAKLHLVKNPVTRQEMLDLLFFLKTFFYYFLAGTCGDEHGYRLTKYLLSNYETSVRPVGNSSEPIVVVFGLSIHHIIDVDEKNQILTVNCWLSQVWNDTHLTWNASDFGGIDNIALPYDRVWRPDIILYNK